MHGLSLFRSSVHYFLMVFKKQLKQKNLCEEKFLQLIQFICTVEVMESKQASQHSDGIRNFKRSFRLENKN